MTPFLLAVGFLTAAAISPAPGMAQTNAQSFELSLFPPLQLRGEDAEIRILRVGLYSKNVAVRGLDVGIVNHSTGGVSKGLQYGLVGVTEGAFLGWQNNLLANINQQEFVGFQGISAYNQIDFGEAVQIGLFNRARDMSGFQLGLVNWAENLHGVQIGLINIISGKESLQFLPIVNWSF
jgi:hypothetical protein